jgi:hypothetical protein
VTVLCTIAIRGDDILFRRAAALRLQKFAHFAARHFVTVSFDMII